MKTIFSDSVLLEVTSYIKEHFPHVTIGLVGEWEGLRYAIEKGGNATRILRKNDSAQNVRFIVACGGSEEIDRAKEYKLPYLVLTRELPLSAFQEIGINDFQIVEYSYPKVVIIDTKENELSLQGDLTFLLTGALLESLGKVGAGVRSERVERTKIIACELKNAVRDFCSTERVLNNLIEWLKEIGGAPFLAMVERVTAFLCPENFAHARFYSIFCLLYALSLFTKIDFWVILPYMDLNRVRILADEMGITTLSKKVRPKDIPFKVGFLEEIMPTKCEILNFLKRFRMEKGVERMDLNRLLLSLTIATTFIKEPNLLVDVVESGYVDALIDF